MPVFKNNMIYGNPDINMDSAMKVEIPKYHLLHVNIHNCSWEWPFVLCVHTINPDKPDELVYQLRLSLTLIRQFHNDYYTKIFCNYRTHFVISCWYKEAPLESENDPKIPWLQSQLKIWGQDKVTAAFEFIHGDKVDTNLTTISLDPRFPHSENLHNPFTPPV